LRFASVGRGSRAPTSGSRPPGSLLDCRPPSLAPLPGNSCVSSLLGGHGSALPVGRRPERATGPVRIPVAPSGDVAQLAEHCLCKAGVRGSIPLVSTHPQSPNTGPVALTKITRPRPNPGPYPSRAPRSVRWPVVPGASSRSSAPRCADPDHGSRADRSAPPASISAPSGPSARGLTLRSWPPGHCRCAEGREALWFVWRWETFAADPVVAGRWSWAKPDPGGAGKGGSSPDNAGTGQYCQMVRVRQA
jgi:hypothetical protein